MRGQIYKVVALLFLLTAAINARSQPAATRPLQVPDTAAPTFTAYTGRDGLSDEIWNSIGFDRDGFVWAGSASQLARFDGYRWIMWPLPGVSSLVRDMVTDNSGVLWAAFEREGLVRYDGQRWQLVEPARSSDTFSTVTSADPVEHWLAIGNGVAQLRDGKWIDDTSLQTIGNSSARVIAHSERLFGERRQWIGTEKDGIWYRKLDPEPGPLTRFVHDGIDGFINQLLLSHDDGEEELWAVGRDGVARIRSSETRTWTRRNGELPSSTVYSIAETRDSTGRRSMWVATRAGLVRVRGDQWVVFDRSHGLPSNVIRRVKVQRVDQVDVLWLATEGGVVRAALTENPWVTASLLGAAEVGIFGVMIEPDDNGGERLWAGSRLDGLALLENGRWRHFDAASGTLPAQWLRGIWRLPDATGRQRRLLGAYDSALLEINDDLSFTALPSPWINRPEDAPSDALARTVGGNLEWWIASLRSGIHRLRNGVWDSFSSPRSGTPWTVWGLREQVDRSGRSWLWAATSHGAARFDGARWELLANVSPVRSARVVALTLIPHGLRQIMWAATTQSGVVRFDVTDPRQPFLIGNDGIPPPPDPSIYSIVADSVGRIYICTNNGVQLLTPSADGYSERVFHRRDGLVHDECNAGSQLVDSSDRYWVGTLGGLGVYDPNASHSTIATTPKALHVTALRVDGQELEPPIAATIKLAANTRELGVEYSLLTGMRESESRYRTQLQGYDEGYTDWVADRSRIFNHLQPGHYTLHIEARDYSGQTSALESLAITIAPAWYQLGWLRMLAGFVVTLIVAVAVWRHERRLLLQQRLLTEQVGLRTAELRDANLRLTELSFVDAMTGVANRRRLEEALQTSVQRALAKGQPIGVIMLDVDHFKDYNDRFGHLAGDTALRSIAQALCAATRNEDLVARYGGEEFACLLVDAGPDVVRQVAERMCVLVAKLEPSALGNRIQGLTISIGALSAIPTSADAAESLLHAADAALYQAKRQGRNRVVIADAISAH